MDFFKIHNGGSNFLKLTWLRPGGWQRGQGSGLLTISVAFHQTTRQH